MDKFSDSNGIKRCLQNLKNHFYGILFLGLMLISDVTSYPLILWSSSICWLIS